MKTAIFFGAGASKADNAPIQSELFYEYFSIPADVLDSNPRGMNEEIKTFFSDFFKISIEQFNKQVFPTFEEVLGMLDLAEIRKESFKNYQLENSFGSKERIRRMRLYFVLLLARVLDYKLDRSNNKHVGLVNQLKKQNLLTDTCFISTNYDILIDNALSLHVDEIADLELEYGVDFSNIEQKRPENTIKLLKLHGSLNWLYCPTCNTVNITKYMKGIMFLLNNQEEAKCKKCNSIRMPVVVPPTLYKDMSNIFLASVWNKAEKYLSDIQHIIFCGYSLPDADIHIKYLLKRIQINRNNDLRITVLNHFTGKSSYEMTAEMKRFEKFFGVKIHYLPFGFEEFSENPIEYMDFGLKTSRSYYNMLVRDKIPQHIEADGKKVTFQILDSERYKKVLNVKLQEELDEYVAAKENDQVDELADLVEVVYAILESKGLSIENFEKIRTAKKEYGGGFEERLSLISVEESDL